MARDNPFARLRRQPSFGGPDIARFLFGGDVAPGIARRRGFGGGFRPPAAPFQPQPLPSPVFDSLSQWEDFYGQQYAGEAPWSPDAQPIPFPLRPPVSSGVDYGYGREGRNRVFPGGPGGPLNLETPHPVPPGVAPRPQPGFGFGYNVPTPVNPIAGVLNRRRRKF